MTNAETKTITVSNLIEVFGMPNAAKESPKCSARREAYNGENLTDALQVVREYNGAHQAIALSALLHGVGLLVASSNNLPKSASSVSAEERAAIRKAVINALPFQVGRSVTARKGVDIGSAIDSLLS